LNVRGRDVVGFLEEARAALARQIQLPASYYLEPN
jgi:Cu/Ag efflux pump CusA